MKTGLVTSVALHAAVLVFAAVSLSAPRPFDVADMEAMPVDIVPVESITKTQQGEKEAPKSEKPAPRPTERPDPVEDAQKVGENDVDLDAPPTPEPRPKPVEKTAQAASEEPQPKSADRPQPVKESEPEPADKPEPKIAEKEPEPAPVPATETAPEPQPKQKVEPDPVEEAIAADNSKPDDSLKLPDSAPVPQARPTPPKPPQAKTAKAPDHKDSDKKPATKAANAAPKQKEDDTVLDDVAALLNKEKASGGGAKRSEQTASLGTKKTTGDTLSQSEMDALRGQIQKCWSVPAGAVGAEDLKVSIRFKLDPSGALEGSPQIVEGGNGSTVQVAAAESARRAVQMCQPYNLPADKYQAWADVLVHFDPSDMF